MSVSTIEENHVSLLHDQNVWDEDTKEALTVLGD